MSVFGFGAMVAALEARLVESLSLSPAPLPPELTRLEGRFRDEPVLIEARAFRGPRVQLARFVTVAGPGLDIGNVLVRGVPELGLPLFGADLVGLGRESAIVVADLSPVVPEGAARGGPAAAIPKDPELPSAGELPGWAKQWFSPQALFARIGPEHRVAAETALQTRLSSFVERARAARPETDCQLVNSKYGEYSRSHLVEDRGLSVLRKMIGDHLSSRFLREVMFPE